MTQLATMLLARVGAGVTAGQPGEVAEKNYRAPQDDADLRYWLENMVWFHRFTPAEIRAATGLTAAQVDAALTRFDISAAGRPRRPAGAPLLALPYPGGRHPRIGFRDGAIRPQRESKVSVFAPWDEDSSGERRDSRRRTTTTRCSPPRTRRAGPRPAHAG